jgi:tetratricopeptide (TPR) repeat protein
MAQQQIQQLDWVQARATLEKLVALEPDDAQALYWLGLLLAPQDHILAGEYLSRAALDATWAARADVVRNALQAYEDRSLADAHTVLGVALIGLEEWPFAEQAFQLALAVNAVNPTALAYLGFAKDQQGRDGLPDIQAALAMAPNDPTVYYLLGQHWRLAQDNQAAYDAFSQAYWLDPANPALAAEVGASLQFLGDLSGAEEWFRLAVALAPDDTRWSGLLAAYYADAEGQLDDQKIEFVRQASQAAPDDPDLHASLGWVYYQTGDYQKAYEELNRAVGFDPTRPRSRYYFAAVLEIMGDTQGAVESYRFVVGALGSDAGFGLLAARALERLGYSPG